MADPVDPTPVKVEKRGDRFAIVDADGKALADGDSYTDEAKARADAAQINASWKGAAKERKANGTPARISEALVAHLASVEPRTMNVVGGHLGLHFDPRLQPAGQRHAALSQVLGKILDHDGPSATAELPHGVTVERRLGKLRVNSQYGVLHFQTPEAAAAVALTGVDKGEVEHGADADDLYQGHMDELARGRAAAINAGHVSDRAELEQVMKTEKVARSARILTRPADGVKRDRAQRIDQRRKVFEDILKA